jgi:spore coat protein A
MRLTRRQMLTAGGAFLAAAAGRAGLEFLERMDAHDGWNCRFSQPLRIPPTLNPVRKDAEADFYEITQKEADVEILPGKRTRIWGYEGMFPGPTMRAQRGRKVVVRQTNQLPVHTVTHPCVSRKAEKWLTSRLIPHRHRPRAEFQPAHEPQVDVLR